MSTLHDFTDVDAPELRELKPLTIVAGPAKGKPLGFVANGNRQKAIVVQRHRHPYEGGKQHYFRKLGGYSFPQRDIDRMFDAGVQTIIIQELDNERVLEFDIQQYLNGEAGGVVGGDEQIGVPTDDAKHSWTAEETVILTANDRKKKQQ